jgi:hypothetical protein
MTHAERQQKIDLYGQAYELLVAGLKQFPPEMWHFRPAPDFWTIHEIVVHITDSEANSYIRGRRFIAEPDAQVMAYDEKRWAINLNYHQQSTEDALELFKWLRHNTYQLIRALPESVWSNTVYHPENGLMTMDDWLHIYERHIPDHLTQMQELYTIWLKQK